MIFKRQHKFFSTVIISKEHRDRHNDKHDLILEVHHTHRWKGDAVLTRSKLFAVGVALDLGSVKEIFLEGGREVLGLGVEVSCGLLITSLSIVSTDMQPLQVQTSTENKKNRRNF